MQKESVYRRLEMEIGSVTNGECNMVANMATVCCLLKSAFSDFYWVGFYLVDPHKDDELVIGPYQGTLGCLRISFGRGVCGTAATTGKTQIVDDVHDFPGHIACDSKTNSEIVVPVYNQKNSLIAVLDIDSIDYSTFDETDRKYLEKIMSNVFERI